MLSQPESWIVKTQAIALKKFHPDLPCTKFKPTNKNITSHKHAFYFTLNIITISQIIRNYITKIFKITDKVSSSTTKSEHREFVSNNFTRWYRISLYIIGLQTVLEGLIIMVLFVLQHECWITQYLPHRTVHIGPIYVYFTTTKVAQKSITNKKIKATGQGQEVCKVKVKVSV